MSLASVKNVLILDTWQALETSHALRVGVKADQIYVANRNVRRGSEAAFKACFTRSLRQADLPKVEHVYPGADILSVARMARLAGTEFDLINYDSCGSVGTLRFMQYVAALADHTRPNGVFAITVLGGRESAAVRDFMSTVAAYSDVNPDIDPSHHGRLHSTRLRIIMSALDAAGSVRRSFREADNNYLYVSSKSPMLHHASRMNRYAACDQSSVLSDALRCVARSARRDEVDDAEFIDLCKWLHERRSDEYQRLVKLLDDEYAASQAAAERQS